MGMMSGAVQAADDLEIAVLGGGCFWCTEAAFEGLDGVKSVVSGYAGGTTENPTYEQVCAGSTGHAEVIQITFDPTQITYAQILDRFWKAHDPTTKNRQGADVGTQYRSIILTTNATQKAVAEKSMTEAASSFSEPIVTEIVPLKKFFPGEAHHQDFYARNPEYGYCRMVIAPKLKKLNAHP